MSLFIYKILISFIFVCIGPQFGGLFTRRDCYKSLSYPFQYIEISHHFPTGPILVYCTFQIIIYPSEKDGDIIDVEKYYIFQRVDFPCYTSILFTSKGRNFSKMILNISFYLFNIGNKLTSFLYTYYNGFMPGKHLLLSKRTNFGLYVNVYKNGFEFIPFIYHYIEPDWSNLQLLAFSYYDICLVTDENLAIVIRPAYKVTKPFGFTTHITATHQGKGFIHQINQITAFDCYTSETNPNESVVFFDELPQTDELVFFLVYLIKNITHSDVKLEKLIIHNIKRENINNFNFQSPWINKVFLIYTILVEEVLTDDTIRIISKSRDGVIYDICELKNTVSLYKISREECVNEQYQL